MITFRRFVYAATFILVALLSVSASPVLAHHSATPYKWSTIPVDVDVSSAPFPSSWITPLSRAMSAWNNAGSRFRFRSWNTGHNVYVSNWGQGAVARTSVTKPGGYTIIDADTAMNAYYSWCDGAYVGCYDLQSVMTHELGHWIMLYDMFDNSSYAMYYKMFTNHTSFRSLESDDITSIRNMYPL